MVVRSFQVRATLPEAVLERLEENLFPKWKTLDNKPLTLPEQTKLLYRGLLGKPGTGKPSLLLTGLDKIRGAITNKTDNWTETLQTNRDDLESRNQAQLEKLLDLLKNNPAEAIKYAIPLDEGGTARGSETVGFTFSLRWSNFSLFGGTGNSGRDTVGSSVLPDDGYQRVIDDFTARNQFVKAALFYRHKLHDEAAGQDLLCVAGGPIWMPTTA